MVRHQYLVWLLNFMSVLTVCITRWEGWGGADHMYHWVGGVRCGTKHVWCMNLGRDLEKQWKWRLPERSGNLFPPRKISVNCISWRLIVYNFQISFEASLWVSLTFFTFNRKSKINPSRVDLYLIICQCCLPVFMNISTFIATAATFNRA